MEKEAPKSKVTKIMTHQKQMKQTNEIKTKQNHIYQNQ